MDFAGAALVGILILAVIGGILGFALRLRGLWIWAAAPALALTAIGGSAVVAPWVGLSWSILPVLFVTIVLAAIVFALRRIPKWAFRPRVARRRFDAWPVVAVALGGVILGVRVVEILGAPDAISQTFDNIFHLNAIRFILDTGNASSLHLGLMTSPSGSLPFYPAGWHGLVSLVAQISGVPPTVAVNATTFVISAAVWPIGVVLLTRTLFGRNRVLTVSAGILAASLPVFPLLLMDYGVLYPFQLGLALLPVVLAATLRALGLVGDRREAPLLWWGLVLLGMIPGLTLAHPGAFVAWLALSFPAATLFAIRRWRAASTTAARWRCGGLYAAYLVVGAGLLIVLRPPSEARGWPLSMTMGDAILTALTGSVWYGVIPILALLATVAGLVWTIVARRTGAILAASMWAIVVVLFVTVAALPLHLLRDALTGSWYNNLPRIAAMFAVVMVPLGSYGIAATWKWIRSRSGVVRAMRPVPLAVRAIAGVLVAIAAVGATQVGLFTPVPTAVRWAHALYTLTPESSLVSSDEFALLERVDEHVPEGVVIAGSPWTGAGLAYAITGRHVLMPHALMEISPELELINDGLNDARPGDAVCDAVEDLDVGFVLDFGVNEVHAGSLNTLPGLQDLGESNAVRLVDQEGDAKLYEIVACGR
ncbi:DUF6541 family protein [Microbacterium sp.]|uniref:DUF6541 family protein n=1 Tax=Microbacterium sp. TaxID=51671 RepID=UPI003F72A546